MVSLLTQQLCQFSKKSELVRIFLLIWYGMTHKPLTNDPCVFLSTTIIMWSHARL